MLQVSWVEVGRGLLRVAADAVVPVLGGLAADWVVSRVGSPDVGKRLAGGAEKAINYFGDSIVRALRDWLGGQEPAARAQALVGLAAVTEADARAEVGARLAEQAGGASPAVRAVAAGYVATLPLSLRRSLGETPPAEGVELPPTFALDEDWLLHLLPLDDPPYPTPAPLADTPYRLEEWLGTGGFGAVYRASSMGMQHLPLAVKLCLDHGLVDGLRQESANLERLMRDSAEKPWSPRIVRLYGYNFEHPTPFLVYEHVAGGDLQRWLLARRLQHGRPLTPAEVLPLVAQVVEALAFVHQYGLVHRDLKPSNVLLARDRTVKLTDFGIGGVEARRAASVSRIGTVGPSQLTLAERATLYRGAGTPLYMSPEQRMGRPPDPRDDLYSLGVLWYQLLANDVTRELHPGWEDELRERYRAPAEHLEVIRACVGWVERRPQNAGELLRLLPLPVATAAQVPHRPEPHVETRARPAPPPQPKTPEARVRGPAIGLLVAGVIGLLLTLALLIVRVNHPPEHPERYPGEQENGPGPDGKEGPSRPDVRS
jgi:serine/threonine-protein kinase